MPAFSARSIVASTLLGTLPPRLPGRLLVAFAEEFGVNSGTTRVALSRMVDRGELDREDGGHYVLAGALLERQDRQEAGLSPTTRVWSGDWEMYIVRPAARGSAERAALRRAGVHLGLGERRDGVWMRPDNLDPDRQAAARLVMAEQADRFVTRPDSGESELVEQLFGVDAWSATAAGLQERMSLMATDLDAGTPGSLTEGFEVAADTLRHLVLDPLLPDRLWPTAWPAAALRKSYEAYNETYRSHLSAFFRSRSRLTG